jgi:hypothetical protein
MEWLTLYAMIALLKHRDDAAASEALRSILTCMVLPPSLEQGYSCNTLVGIH